MPIACVFLFPVRLADLLTPEKCKAIKMFLVSAWGSRFSTFPSWLVSDEKISGIPGRPGLQATEAWPGPGRELRLAQD